MTTEEFSNSFDTVLSSYLHNAQFGELSSIADVALDEYEKSIFLTLAQDLIVKTYYERQLNSQGAGFDDSSRRLMDYAKLITTKTFDTLKEYEEGESSEAFSETGIMINFNSENSGNVFGSYTDEATGQEYLKSPLFIINERVVAGKEYNVYTPVSEIEPGTYYIKSSGINSYTPVNITEEDKENYSDTLLYKQETKTDSRSYTVIPLNYREYDRMMSRAYCEPLKRQAWRLFETDANDLTISSELILRSDAGEFLKYVVRYVRRPRPIVLVDLDNTANALTIDGVQKRTECELNPVIHNEILQLAVQLALNSRGIETRDMKAAREQLKRNND